MADDNKILEAEDSAVYQDDSIELRLQELVEEHARERAQLAEIISKLQEENQKLVTAVAALKERTKNSHLNTQAEQFLGLDFSIHKKTNAG
ncbi:hypothetical protein [Oceanimonas sp. CAM02]|uniref:hypothetical protein n=1 Tax=Oceanimonas sp. CAM02 TaxID=3080336 RepID=UPI00293605A1|nr:hypothetical protein [Oceanimonas sp. CAM02]MDV2857231.1 hypothetical protein [Oceanimonas sp. CAM02]